MLARLDCDRVFTWVDAPVMMCRDILTLYKSKTVKIKFPEAIVAQ